MKRIISTWHVTLVTACTGVFWTIPIVFAVVHTFGLELYFNRFWTLMIGVSVCGLIGFGVALFLWLRHRALHYRVEAHYRPHFASALLLSGLGIIGTVVMLVQFGMNPAWVLQVMLVLFIVNYIFLVEIGKAIYRVSLFGVHR